MMMGRLRCTWQELQDMPADVVKVFYAFVEGEGEAQAAMAGT